MEHWAPEFRYLRTRRRMPDSVNKRSSVFDRRLRCWRTDEGHTALMEDDERRSIEAVSQPAQPHTPPTWRRHRLVPARAVCRYRITEIAASTVVPLFSAPPRGGPVVKTSTRYSTFYASVVSLRFCSHRCRSLDVTCSRICARPQIFFRLLRCCALTEN